MITGKYGKLIEELSKGRTEITTEMICEARRLYFIRKRTLVDSEKGLVKEKRVKTRRLAFETLIGRQEIAQLDNRYKFIACR